MIQRTGRRQREPRRCEAGLRVDWLLGGSGGPGSIFASDESDQAQRHKQLAPALQWCGPSH